MFINALEKVSASITNIIRITQITFEFVNNALLIYYGGLASATLMSSAIFLLIKTDKFQSATLHFAFVHFTCGMCRLLISRAPWLLELNTL